MEELKRVALYIRVSTDKQAKDGDSLEAQENALVKYAKDKNYIIVDKYIDGGESGQKLNRTNLTRLLSDVKNDKIDLIIMTKLDRWFRSVSDFYKVNELLQKHKVKWLTIWEEYDTTTANGEFWLNMNLSMARMEAQRTSERINSVFDYKYNVQKTVCSGAKKFGYKINKEKKYVVDEKEKDILIDLFNYYFKCNNLSETTRWFSNKYHKISLASIKKYLKDTAYIGLYKKYNSDIVVKDFTPPIIEEKLFNEVQALLNKNIKSNTSNIKKNTYIFSGILRCPTCRKKMSGQYTAKNNKIRKYYRCNANKILTCDNSKSISEEKLNKYLSETLSEHIKNIIKVNKIATKKSTKTDTTKLKNKLKKLVELYTENLINIDYYKKEYHRLQNEINKIEKQNNQVKVKDTSKLQALLKQDIKTIYLTLTDKEKQRLLRSFIDHIIVYEYDKIKIESISF